MKNCTKCGRPLHGVAELHSLLSAEVRDLNAEMTDAGFKHGIDGGIWGRVFFDVDPDNLQILPVELILAKDL